MLQIQKNVIKTSIFWGLFLCLGLAVLFSPHRAVAAINPQINFQGKLTNPDGTNVADGTYSIVFSIYSVSSGGTATWTETQPTVSVASGIFQVALGSVTALPGSVDFNSTPLYLGMKVGADAEMTPRIQFTAAPYAFNAEKLGGISSSGFVQLSPGTQQTGDIDVSGSVNGLTLSTAGIQPASAGAFSINANGANALSVDGETVNVGVTSAITIQVGASNVASATQTINIGNNSAASATSDINLGSSVAGTTAITGDTTVTGRTTDTASNTAFSVTNDGTGNIVKFFDNGDSTNPVFGLADGGAAIFRNQTDSTAAFQVQNAAGTAVLNVDTTNKQVAITGGIMVNTADSSIVRSTYSDFALGTIGTDLVNVTSPSGQLELSDGTIPNSGLGTVTTAGQPAVNAALGAGASAITRPDGKYLIIRGGATTAMSIYDANAGTITASAQTLNAAAGTGSLAIPRPGGMYVVIRGGATPATGTTNLDPTGTTTPVTAGPTLTATAGAGTVATKRADGRYLIALGSSGTAGATNLYDPIANTVAAGPTSTVAWGVGSLALPRPDGTVLFATGGAASTTQLYNPSTGASSIGAFSVGPSLDGAAAAGTCGINGAGSVALKRADGKYVILSKLNVSTLYDPVSNSMTCRTTIGPATALGDGAHAIPLQNGKFLVIVGGGGTASYVYDPTTDTFTAQGTVLSAVSAGAFSLMRPDGTWQIFNGGGTVTNNYNTGLPMSGTTTKYTMDDISTTALNTSSTLKWTAQNESAYVGTNGSTNTAFSNIQFFVRTATNAGSCTTSLNAAADREIMSSGDFIRPAPGETCVRITTQFNRPIPKRIVDERGTWTGNNSTVTRLDYATPAVFDITVDNTSVLHRDNFTFTAPTAQANNNGTIPTALTSGAPTAGGACTAGNHFWFVSFAANGSESQLSPASAVQSCTAGNGTVALTTIPTGPAGTTARKIYRTAAGKLVTDTPYLLTTIADNTTTTYSDTLADTSLGAMYAAYENSGPTVTRVEAVNGQLTLPYGRINPTALVGTTQYYQGNVTTAHPPLPQAQTVSGTMVLARPNKTFVVIASLSTPAANAALYDPASQTFTAQGGSNIPTAANGPGGFAWKRPDGKFLVVLGNGTTATNIYDPDTNVFSPGPALGGLASVGALALPNTDGTVTIVHGGGLTTSNIYDPTRNTMIAGPTLTTAANCGAWAVPLANGKYKMFVGSATTASATMNYNASTKVFVGGANMTSAHGCGSFVFQRPDGYWLSVSGGAATTTNLINPVDGTTAAGPAVAATGAGGHVIPRADGTFLILNGASGATSNVYIPYGGTNALGSSIGTMGAGPAVTAISHGALSFQRPDGKWVTINGSITNATQLADTGWYPDGQYLSEQVQVPALAANSVLNWRQTADNYVRMEVRYASSQAALATTPYVSVGKPGGSMGNPGGETWVQVEVNLRRDFPTFGGALSGVYVSGGGAVYPYRQITQPSVLSYSINNGSDLLTLQNNGLNVMRVTSEGNVYSSSSGGFFSGGADLAENYTSTESLQPGEVVAIDPAGNHGVKRTVGSYQSSVLGVVSTAPGFVAGSYTENSYPVALVGRVPVKISSENGMVHEGDFLTAASIPGYAMKATLSGRVIGTALESFDEANATACPSSGAGAVASTLCGSVMMFVNLTDYQGASVEALMATDPAGQFTGDTVIPAVAFPEANGLAAGQKQAEILAFLQALKNRQAAGLAPKGGDILTDRLSAANEIISPVMVADIVRANTIQAKKIEGLEVFTDKLSSLSQQYAGLKTQVSQASGATPAASPQGAITFGGAASVVSLVSLGTIEAQGGLVVQGASQFNGNTTFMTLARFMDSVVLAGDVSADGRVTFNADTAGAATVVSGGTKVRVTFAKEYAEKPFVSAQLVAVPATLPDGTQEDTTITERRLFAAGYTYIISDSSTKGFTIVLSKKAAENLQFNWQATAVKNARSVTGTPDQPLPVTTGGTTP